MSDARGETVMAKKAPNPIDKHVGSRVRMRRMMLSMSQEKLGDALGLTFQQVQKYEKGTNRIGASRLQQISNILQVPVAFFFEGAPDIAGAAAPRRQGRALADLRGGLPGDVRRPRADQGVHAHRRPEAATAHRRSGRADRRRRRADNRRRRRFRPRACPCGLPAPPASLPGPSPASRPGPAHRRPHLDRGPGHCKKHRAHQGWRGR